jgi:hypothetical protein
LSAAPEGSSPLTRTPVNTASPQMSRPTSRAEFASPCSTRSDELPRQARQIKQQRYPRKTLHMLRSWNAGLQYAYGATLTTLPDAVKVGLVSCSPNLASWDPDTNSLSGCLLGRRRIARRRPLCRSCGTRIRRRRNRCVDS